MKVYQFYPEGVCSRQMSIKLDEENVIKSVDVTDGCSGNIQGIASLIRSMGAENAIVRLKGIRCGTKSTSCPDQLAQGLERMLRDRI